jgi:hypothetical protein
MAVTPIWSQADVDQLKAAVLALGSGQGVQTVTYSGPPARTVVYQPADLPKMQSLLAQVNAAVRDAAGDRRGYRVAGYRKGL